MQFFVDSDDIEAIVELFELGIVDGVTTNPLVFARSGRDPRKAIAEICELVKTSVSIEVIASQYNAMLNEAQSWLDMGFGSQITIKLPITMEGLRACKTLISRGIMVNMTLCFSPTQAMLAAKAGATYVSIFMGRLDDIGHNGIELVRTVCDMFNHYPEINTQVLAASIRHQGHIIGAAKAGADVITASPHILRSLVTHPLTAKGVIEFEQAGIAYVQSKNKK
ncbi:MAG: fructose-6-phosphate aldolase [Proteobacteria bacterium]|nr:fructose-6-phosphate aldolase [Pseudomonadota bacterium]